MFFVLTAYSFDVKITQSLQNVLGSVPSSMLWESSAQRLERSVPRRQRLFMKVCRPSVSLVEVFLTSNSLHLMAVKLSLTSVRFQYKLERYFFLAGVSFCLNFVLIHWYNCN